MNEHDEVLRDALAGIKTKRTRRRITRFNPSDGLLLDIEEGKVYVPGNAVRSLSASFAPCLELAFSNKSPAVFSIHCDVAF